MTSAKSRLRLTVFVTIATLLEGCDRSPAASDPARTSPAAMAQAPAPAAVQAAPARMFTDGLTRGSWVGAVPPEIKLETIISGPPGGAPITLESLRGKVVVVAFWSTHCPTCPTVLPQLNRLAEAFRGQPVVFLSVLNEPEADVRAFLQKTPVNTWIALDTDVSITNDWFIPGVPMVAVVNAKGVLVAKSHPKNVNEAQIRDALAGRTIKAPLPPLPDGFLDNTPATQMPMLEAMIRPADANAGWGRSLAGGVRLRGHTLREILGTAWRVDPQLIVSSTLLLDAKYDVTVVPPEGREQEAIPMLRRLLEETFQLAARMEERPVRALALKAGGGGAKLAQPTSARYEGMVNVETGQIIFKNSQMANVGAAIYFALGAEKPVLDETGLTGAYDVSLNWSPGDAESVKKNVREQLGLELEPVERTLKVLVAERIGR